jgi:hypothetical protein
MFNRLTDGPTNVMDAPTNVLDAPTAHPASHLDHRLNNCSDLDQKRERIVF